MKPQPTAVVPRVALTREEAAASLGVSLSHFARHVAPDLRMIRSGSVRLIPLRELERWASETATLAGGSHEARMGGPEKCRGAAATAPGVTHGGIAP
jgi:hypothetical protein